VHFFFIFIQKIDNIGSISVYNIRILHLETLVRIHS
jgi:hypothetical protein